MGTAKEVNLQDTLTTQKQVSTLNSLVLKTRSKDTLEIMVSGIRANIVMKRTMQDYL